MRRFFVALLAVSTLAVCAPTQAASASMSPQEVSFLKLAWAIHTDPTLVCIRHHESDRGHPPLFDQGYGAINPSSGTGGAYQFMPSTWRSNASHWGVGALVGSSALGQPAFVQDVMALALLRWQGSSPWQGSGC